MESKCSGSNNQYKMLLIAVIRFIKAETWSVSVVSLLQLLLLPRVKCVIKPNISVKRRETLMRLFPKFTVGDIQSVDKQFPTLKMLFSVNSRIMLQTSCLVF